MRKHARIVRGYSGVPVAALPTPVPPAKNQNHTCKCMWHLPLPHPAGLHVLMGQPIASRRYRSMRITDRAGIKVRYHPWTNTWSLHPFGQPHEVLVPRITSPWIWHLRINCPCTRYSTAYSAYRCRHWPSLMRTASTDKPIFPEIGILWRKRRACDLRIPTPHGGSPAFRLAWPIVATDFPDLRMHPWLYLVPFREPLRLPVVLKQPGPEAALASAEVWPSDACSRAFKRGWQGPGEGVLRPHPLPAFRPRSVSPIKLLLWPHHGDETHLLL